jgi:type I restriction enzyme M protein
MRMINSSVGNIRKGPDSLGRYYTKKDIGSFLVDQISSHVPSRLLDLGAGTGSLSGAAIKRWSNIEILTVDIDKASAIHLGKLFSVNGNFKHNHINTDALSDNLPEIISSQFGSVDTAVCNPPFTAPKWRKGFAQILEEAGFSGSMPVLTSVDAALLFLAQNLRVLSNQATLGIILPDSLISGAKYRQFRKDLLQNYNVLKAIRLPRGSFSNTDALAHILVIRKGSATSAAIPLESLTNNQAEQLLIDADEAIERLDFNYHAQRLVTSKTQGESITLRSIIVDFKRGSLSSSEGRLVDTPVFHTTDIQQPLFGKWCDLSHFCSAKKRAASAEFPVRAQPGDILVARVGRNLERKIIGVASGHPILTDCIYRVRVHRQFRNKVLALLKSKKGQAWLASQAYGVGARQLTKAALLEFPISI